MLRVLRFFGVLLPWLMAACMSVEHGTAAPMSSRIYDVRAGRYIDRDVLEERLLTARFRLLGEVHDNPAHHALRAELLRTIAAAGKHPAVVFEQLDQPNEEAVRASQRAGADADALVRAGAFDRRSWEWPLHKPLFDAALQAGLAIHAGNISRATLSPSCAAAMCPVSILHRVICSTARDGMTCRHIRWQPRSRNHIAESFLRVRCRASRSRNVCAMPRSQRHCSARRRPTVPY